MMSVCYAESWVDRESKPTPELCIGSKFIIELVLKKLELILSISFDVQNF